MCGIVGYTGNNNSVDFLIKGLSMLEYRGYDSAGIAVLTENGIKCEKEKGRIANLQENIKANPAFKGCSGIGHTRWATHGEPSRINSHPHKSMDGKFYVVHNGIIENYMFIKEMLIKKGYKFVSETDTEAIAHLLQDVYRGDLKDAVISALKMLEGSFAIGIVSEYSPGVIIGAKKDSPLVIGRGDGENYFASDINTVASFSKNVYLLNDMEIAFVDKNNIEIFDVDKKIINKEEFNVNWKLDCVSKDGFESFMEKEICEEPTAVKNTLSKGTKDGKISLSGINLKAEEINNISKIIIVGCGSAYHAGLVGKYVIENLISLPVEVDLASEFRYRNPVINNNTLVVLISQSGETADTLAALREAKKKGATILSVVNAKGSTIARESHHIIYTEAGTEIAVATTKAFGAQLTALYLVALFLGEKKGILNEEKTKKLTSELLSLPEKINIILKNKEQIKAFAKIYQSSKNVFYIGRGIDYPVAMEGALKLKEITYIHAEAYAAGELKHGTISLIEEGTPVVAIVTQKDLKSKTFSNIKEAKARGAVVLAVTNESSAELLKMCDNVFVIPDCNDLWSASLSVVPLQLFGLFVCGYKGLDADKPKNLAKSVTVE